VNEEKVTRGLAWLDNRAAERRAEMARTRRARWISVGCVVLVALAVAVLLAFGVRWLTMPAGGVAPRSPTRKRSTPSSRRWAPTWRGLS